MSLPLHKAAALAERIVATLAEYCERIEIAGSIRRARENVNDIDLVVLLKAGQTEAFRARCLRNSTSLTDGPQNLIVQLPCEFQLDVFIARPPERNLLDTTPGNFGTLLLCRTGSKEHNIFLCQRAQSMGLHWNPYQGLFHDNKLIESESEEEILKALGLGWIPPVARER